MDLGHPHLQTESVDDDRGVSELKRQIGKEKDRVPGAKRFQQADNCIVRNDDFVTGRFPQISENRCQTLVLEWLRNDDQWLYP